MKVDRRSGQLYCHKTINNKSKIPNILIEAKATTTTKPRYMSEYIKFAMVENRKIGNLMPFLLSSCVLHKLLMKRYDFWNWNDGVSLLVMHRDSKIFYLENRAKEKERERTSEIIVYSFFWVMGKRHRHTNETNSHNMYKNNNNHNITENKTAYNNIAK